MNKQRPFWYSPYKWIPISVTEVKLMWGGIHYDTRTEVLYMREDGKKRRVKKYKGKWPASAFLDN